VWKRNLVEKLCPDLSQICYRPILGGLHLDGLTAVSLRYASGSFWLVLLISHISQPSETAELASC
jgi:hypothetical protein